jgi:hypothetical protein
MAVEELVEVTTVAIRELQGEGIPNLAGFPAPNEEMVGIFIARAMRASSRGCKVVPKPPVIGGESTLLGKPDENLALEGGAPFPGLQSPVILQQLLKKGGIDITVR